MLQIRGRLLLFWVALPFEGLGLSLLCILVGVLCELCGKKDFDREERKGIASSQSTACGRKLHHEVWQH
jgi:hypothetical protein